MPGLVEYFAGLKKGAAVTKSGLAKMGNKFAGHCLLRTPNEPSQKKLLKYLTDEGVFQEAQERFTFADPNAVCAASFRLLLSSADGKSKKKNKFLQHFEPYERVLVARLQDQAKRSAAAENVTSSGASSDGWQHPGQGDH